MKSLAPIFRFKDLNDDSKGFILRHDVDFDMGLAEKMAQIEFEADIKSTFFVLLGCETYNILSKSNRSIISNISNMGHEFGLHFDPTLYSEKLEVGFEKEVKILSDVIQEDVKSVSLHKPSVHGQYPMFNGYVNAYDKKYFETTKYISDSSMNFRGKDPFNFIEKIRQLEIMQVLIHPMHFSDLLIGYGEITAETFIRKMNAFYADYSDKNDAFIEDIGPSYIDYFISNFKGKFD